MVQTLHGWGLYYATNRWEVCTPTTPNIARRNKQSFHLDPPVIFYNELMGELTGWTLQVICISFRFPLIRLDLNLRIRRVHKHMRRFSSDTIKRLGLRRQKDRPVEMSVKDVILLYFAILRVEVNETFIRLFRIKITPMGKVQIQHVTWRRNGKCFKKEWRVVDTPSGVPDTPWDDLKMYGPLWLEEGIGEFVACVVRHS
jgi:hypothetical protein